MLYGIVFLSLIKAINHTVLYLCIFVWFCNTFLIQIKVCWDTLCRWLVWFMAYESLTKTTLKYLWFEWKKIEPSPLEKWVAWALVHSIEICFHFSKHCHNKIAHNLFDSTKEWNEWERTQLSVTLLDLTGSWTGFLNFVLLFSEVNLWCSLGFCIQKH